MLLDSEPLIDVVNRKHRKILFPVFELMRWELFQSAILRGVCFDASSGTPVVSELSRAQFLSYNILQIGSDAFTVRDVIRICCHELGGVHVGTVSEKNKKFVESITARNSIIHAVCAISKIFAEATLILVGDQVPVVPYDRFLAHYNLFPSFLGFEHHHFLETRNMSKIDSRELAVCAVLEFVDSAGYANGTIYSIGDVGSASRAPSSISLGLDSNGKISTKVSVGGAILLEHVANNEVNINRKIRVISSVDAGTGGILKITTSVNGSASTVEKSLDSWNLEYREHVIGANLAGLGGASFSLYELAILQRCDFASLQDMDLFLGHKYGII
jgi:hypothetical protein